jgi:hypothetical protein
MGYSTGITRRRILRREADPLRPASLPPRHLWNSSKVPSDPEDLTALCAGRVTAIKV